MIPDKYRLKNTIKYPTSLIIGGLSKLGLEIADSLIEQGGYVIVIDTYTEENIKKLDIFPKDTLISFLDFTAIPHLDEDIRRLDYVFYFNHESTDFNNKVSTQQFLTFSNYLDATLSLASKFDAKSLLTTAIRAHQLVLMNQEVGINYGIGSSQKHTVYTDMEVQKYAESLTIEYVEKIKLDARIIRLGEIIGDGIDFTNHTVFTELVLNAAKGEPLRLRKDGLETEYYVHILDAAYGIIKAQFSRNTTGEIYSLSYENSFTNLSVAYKIQELDPDSPEIVFADEKDNLPAVKFYKPSPNLSKIGWIPKIPFEKAVKQSLAAAKIYLLENQVPPGLGNKKVVDKIKDFFTIANTEQTTLSDIDNSGPISRLIAERKRQDEMKKRSMESAADSIKIKRKHKPRSTREKIRSFLWNIFLNLGNTFKFFKNKTPTEVGLIFIFIIFLFLFYIFVFSPLIVLGRNILLTIPEYQQAQSNFQNSNYVALERNVSNIQGYLTDSQNVISKYEGMANLLSLNNQYSQVQHILSQYILFCDGFKNIGYSIEPFNNYLSNYQNNTQLRAATDSDLSINKNGLDYSSSLSDFNDRIPYLDLGISKVNKAIQELDNANYNLIPGTLSKYFLQINSDIKKDAAVTKYLTSGEYINELLGMNTPQNYLILVLDNTRQTPVGGEIAAFAILSVKNGSLTEAIVQSPDEVSNFNFASIDSRTLQEINNRKFTYKSLENLALNDITGIRDYSLFSQVISRVFQDTYNRKISATITLNYTALDNLLKSLNNNGSSVSVNSISFDNGDFLQHLSQTQIGNENIRAKHAITAQLLANIMNNLLNNIKGNFPSLMATLTNDEQNNNILVDASNLNYSKYIANQDLNSTEIIRDNTYVTPAINTYDPKVVNIDKYSSIYAASVVNINSDLSMNYTLDLKFPTIGSAQEVSVCLPLTIPTSTIKIDKISPDRVTINTSDQEKCVAMQILSETDVTVTWIVPPLGLNISNNTYNLFLGLGKVRGTNMTSDFKITTTGSLKLTNIDPSVFLQNNSAIFTQLLQTDQNLRVTLNK